MRMRMRKTGLTMIVLLGGALVVPLTASTAQAGGGCHGAATEGTASVVTLVNACFDQTITRVPVGAKVTWANKDPMTHVVIGQGYAWGTEADLQQGDRFSTVFRAAGIYPYTCYLHPGMNGAVVVGGVDAPKLDAISGSPVTDSAISRQAPQAPARAISTQAATSRTSAGPWQATTAIGFALAFVLGLGLIRQRLDRRLPDPEA
jgi:plastocyanin